MSTELLLFIPVLVFSVVVHEVAHAWQARREGDMTAAELGRITLNPFPHLDLWGSLIVPLLLWFGSQGVVVFGWARPVPVNPSNFRSHPWGDIRVSLAGIVANLGLAVLFALLAFFLAAARLSLGSWAVVLVQGAIFGVFINLLLAFFNLLPVPPLDGSHVVAHLLPPRAAEAYRNFGRFGVLALMLVVFVWPDVLSLLLAPVGWILDGVVSAVSRWS